MTLYTVISDGGCLGNPGPMYGSFKVTGVDESLKPQVVYHSDRIEFGHGTNNVAEYDALLSAMMYAAEKKLEHVTFLTDSQLVVMQGNGTYKVKEEHLKRYAMAVSQALKWANGEGYTWKLNQAARATVVNALGH